MTITWLGRAVAVGAALAAAAALIEFRAHPTWDARLVGLGQLRNSVVAALTFSAALLIALDVALHDARAWRLGAVVAFAVIGAAIVATGSRNGYVSAAVGIWVALLAAARESRERLAMGLAAPVAVLLAAIAFALLEPISLAAVFPRGDSFRAAIWNAEWQRFVAGNPWFGLGTLTSDRVVIDAQTFAHPHNLYLASTLQGGMVGLVTLLTVLGCTVWKLVGSVGTREARLALSLLVCGATAYLFDGWELIDKVSLSWLVIWLPVSIALALGMPSLRFPAPTRGGIA
jgi:O-antigen ligase